MNNTKANNSVMKNLRHLSLLLIFCVGVLTSLTDCTTHPKAEGELLYSMYCSNCHLDDGKGLGALIPPLAGSDYLVKHRNELACLLVHGIADTIYVNGQMYAEAMPGAEKLSHIEVTNILNYIQNAWGNNYGRFQPEDVRSSLKACDH
jgi:mono/diheme cytochrome c family protein